MRRWIVRYWRAPLLAAGGLVAVCLLALLMAKLVPPFSRSVAEADAASAGELTAKERLDAIDVVRGRILEVVAGLGFLCTFVVTLLTYRLSVLQHRAEHIGRAVAQLGAMRAFERTGGVLELEQIMRRWPGSHSEIVDVLATFIRERTRDVAATGPPGGPAGSAVKLRPEAAVQAALSVLGRRRDRFDHLSFNDTDLRGAVVRKGHLRGVRLRRANLQDCHFERTHLEGAKLRDAHLEGADLERAHLERANLAGAHLQPWIRPRDGLARPANLKRAHLNRADLRNADLREAQLSGAVLRCADLRSADLRLADLRGAKVRGAHLAGVKPAGLSLIDARGRPHCRPEQRCDREMVRPPAPSVTA